MIRDYFESFILLIGVYEFVGVIIVMLCRIKIEIALYRMQKKDFDTFKKLNLEFLDVIPTFKNAFLLKWRYKQYIPTKTMKLIEPYIPKRKRKKKKKRNDF